MSDIRAAAYVSWGLWVADCPRKGCLGAEHAGPAPVTGCVGGLTAPVGSLGPYVGTFKCARCELYCLSEWPANAADIWWVLTQRPLMETRNWVPTETLEDLLLENIAHDLIPVALDAGPLRIVDGRMPDYALTSGSRPAIGGGSN